MKRDIKNIKRDLEDTYNSDIIYKKDKIGKMFEEDPDLLEILNPKQPRPINKFKDPENPTDEEKQLRKEIEEYNKKITHRQILPWLKLIGINKEVLNFIMYDIEDKEVSYANNVIKNQRLTIMCLVHEDDMDTEYNITRADLLAYIVKDLLHWSNALGFQLKCINDYDDIVDFKYYSRTLVFEIQELNINKGHTGMNNKYDRFN
jgi:hypothetical protein